MTHIAKIVEIIGSSEKGWEEAAQVALDEVKKTIHGITGLEVTDMTAKVDQCLREFNPSLTCSSYDRLS
jgi:dodecin